ncbi:MAG: hypothetical protein H6839_17815 [Planctomycetes bacterium]|nr:hypothetical protein [Planctomycetota bacterium]
MRRDISIIAGITVLVVVLVLILGPSFMGRVDTDPRPANVSGKKTLGPPSKPVPSGGVPEPVPSTSDEGTIRLRAIDAVTGEVLQDAKATVSNLYSDSIVVGEWHSGVTDDIRLTTSVRVSCVRVYANSHLMARVAPVEVRPGQLCDLGDVALTPIYPVTLWPGDDTSFGRKIRVTRVWPPPSLGTDQPIELEKALLEGVQLELVPGSYQCSLLPTRLPDLDAPEGDTAPELGFDEAFRFEVVDQPLFLKPIFERAVGTKTIDVQLRNLDGAVPRPSWVWVVAHRPPLRDLVVVAHLTDENGHAALEGLLPGEYTVVAGREEFAAETLRAIAHVDVSPDDANLSVDLSIREYAFDGQRTLQSMGGLQVSVTLQGKPAPEVAILDLDATRWYEDAGAVLAKTDASGRATLTATKTGIRRLRFGRQSLRVFDVIVRPGELAQLDVELCPSGTSIVRGTLDLARRRIEYLHARTGVDEEPVVQLSVDDESKFVVLDAPVGSLQLETMIDRGHIIDFTIKVPEQPETEWSSALDRQAVEAELPEGVDDTDRLGLDLRSPPDGNWWCYESLEVSNLEASKEAVKLIELRAGFFQLRLRRGTDVWTSDAFVVLNSAVRIVNWAHAELPVESDRPVVDESQIVEVRFQLPLSAVPPWTEGLRVYSRPKAADNEFRDRPSWVRSAAGAFGISTFASTRATSLWFHVESMQPEEVDLVPQPPNDGGTRITQLDKELRPATKSRLIQLQCGDGASEPITALWNMRLLFSSSGSVQELGVATRNDTLTRREIRRPAADAQLVRWQGKPALWLPDLQDNQGSLRLRVPGFAYAELDLKPDTAGYLELICTLEADD